MTMVMSACTMKSLQFCYLFCWFKMSCECSNDVECVNILLTKMKAKVQHSFRPETDFGCSYREAQARSPQDKGYLNPMATPYLKIIFEMASDHCWDRTVWPTRKAVFHAKLLCLQIFFSAQSHMFWVPQSHLHTMKKVDCKRRWRAEPQRDKRQCTVGLVNVRCITALVFSAELVSYKWECGIRY